MISASKRKPQIISTPVRIMAIGDAGYTAPDPIGMRVEVLKKRQAGSAVIGSLSIAL